jgi:hypothetical protein
MITVLKSSPWSGHEVRLQSTPAHRVPYTHNGEKILIRSKLFIVGVIAFCLIFRCPANSNVYSMDEEK